MTEQLSDDDVREQFVAGAMLTGLAYSRDEARRFFDEWLDDVSRAMQAEALREAADTITDGMNLRVYQELIGMSRTVMEKSEALSPAHAPGASALSRAHPRT